MFGIPGPAAVGELRLPILGQSTTLASGGPAKRAAGTISNY